ncbi:MAG: cupin-like domain-containing protein [Chitinophagales bacterium]|nr:cupin-like domain-containing protein [Chitinophagales bacterium]
MTFKERLYLIKYKLLFITEHLIGIRLFDKYFNKYRERLNDNVLNQEIKDNISISNSAVTSIGDKILLFRQAAKDWEAVKNWNLDYFKTHYGDKIVEINDSTGLVAENAIPEKRERSLSNFIDQVKEGSLQYLKLSDIVHNDESLKSQLDYDFLSSFKPTFSLGETYYTFIGGKGSLTPMHNEIPCNLYVQINGTKKWILYQPDDFPYLETRAERRPYFYSQVNPNIENDQSFPLLKHAKKIEIVLKAGDVLYVPPFYWHYVENMTDCISVAYKFANVPLCLKSSKLFTLLTFLATKPSVFTSFIVRRLKNKDYVLTE